MGERQKREGEKGNNVYTLNKFCAQYIHVILYM